MKIKIIAATLTTKELELITEDGESLVIPTSNPQASLLIDAVLPITSQGDVAVIDLEDYRVQSLYDKFEQDTGGLVKFFRVAKAKVAAFFADPMEVPVDARKICQEILNQGDSTLSDEETVVSKIGDTYIPGMEKLSSHIQHSLTKMGNTGGIINFLKRIGAVIHERQHSIEDLLTFMEKADLPIAHDGSIIVYKGLRKTDKPGIYVDNFTKKVTQKVGSLVHMDPGSVDTNRGRNCSAGLHVARKGYLSSYPSDVIALCKVNPEDVITVPEYDSSKMRVSAYRILSILPDSDADAVRKGQPMLVGSVGSLMLATALQGHHEEPTSKVFIGGPLGTKLKLTGFDDMPTGTSELPTAAVAIPQVQTIADTSQDAPKINMAETANKIKKAKKMTKSAELRLLIEIHQKEKDRGARQDILREILDIKRTSKKSWEYHGVSPADAKRITELAKTL